jgi:hypothetical protein
MMFFSHENLNLLPGYPRHLALELLDLLGVLGMSRCNFSGMA